MHHNSHRRQTVLTIGDEEAARNSPHIVTLEHARNLVAHGVAEWIGEPPAQRDDPMPRDHEISIVVPSGMSAEANRADAPKRGRGK